MTFCWRCLQSRRTFSYGRPSAVRAVSKHKFAASPWHETTLASQPPPSFSWHVSVGQIDAGTMTTMPLAGDFLSCWYTARSARADGARQVSPRDLVAGAVVDSKDVPSMSLTSACRTDMASSSSVIMCGTPFGFCEASTRIAAATLSAYTSGVMWLYSLTDSAALHLHKTCMISPVSLISPRLLASVALTGVPRVLSCLDRTDHYGEPLLEEGCRERRPRKPC